MYFKHVRLERPAIGTFNGRDIFVLLAFIIVLPALYLVLPGAALTGFLVVTFFAALWIALRPLLPARLLLLLIPAALALDIVITYSLLGTRSGWQVYWIVTSTIVMLAAVGVSNLYVQGGMRLRHIAWFALFLAVYDVVFSLIIPLTPRLADAFEGRPLNASVGYAMDSYRANIGLGDLLVYSLYTIAAYKGFGNRGVGVSLVIITIFGALIPSLVPLIVETFTRGSLGIVVPAQTFFGPVAFLTYLWLARGTRERSMAEWWASEEAAGRMVARRRPQRAASRLALANATESRATSSSEDRA